MDLDGLLGFLRSPQPGSPNHELTKALIQVRVAELERETARDSLRWAKLTAFSTAVASIIAVIALLVSLLN